MQKVKIVSAPLSDIAKVVCKLQTEILQAARRPESINGEPFILSHRLAKHYARIKDDRTYKNRLKQLNIEPRFVGGVRGIALDDLQRLGVKFD